MAMLCLLGVWMLASGGLCCGWNLWALAAGMAVLRTNGTDKRITGASAEIRVGLPSAAWCSEGCSGGRPLHASKSLSGGWTGRCHEALVRGNPGTYVGKELP